MASTKYVVNTHNGESYEITADRIAVDPTNSNRITFYKGSGANEHEVAQENNTSSCRPASA